MDNYNKKLEVHTIRALCTGVSIQKRGVKDDSLVYVLLTEDDECWFVSKHQCLSTFWLPEQIIILQQTKIWLDYNTIKGKWGWRLPITNKVSGKSNAL